MLNTNLVLITCWFYYVKNLCHPIAGKMAKLKKYFYTAPGFGLIPTQFFNAGIPPGKQITGTEFLIIIVSDNFFLLAINALKKSE